MKDFKVLLIYANTPMEPLVPLGTACIYTTLVEAGFPTKIFDNTLYLPNDESNSQAARANSMQVKPVDYTAVGLVGIERDPRDDFKKLVHEFKPDLIGLSCVELTYLKGLQLLETVKDLNIPTVIGGCFATFAAEYCINSDLIDMVCTGEGELISPRQPKPEATHLPSGLFSGGNAAHRRKITATPFMLLRKISWICPCIFSYFGSKLGARRLDRQFAVAWPKRIVSEKL